MQIGAATVESSMEIPQKIKNGTALWLSNSTTGNLSKETQNANSKEHKNIFTAALFTSQDLKAAQVSISRWIGKQRWYIYIMKYYSVTKKEEKFILCDSMDGLGDHYTREMNQAE